jgi:signal peptidase I
MIFFAPAAKWLVTVVPPDTGLAAMIAILVAGILLLIFAVAQSVLQSRRIRAVLPAWFNRWYVYVGVYFLTGTASFALGLLPIPTSNSYNIPSGSMTPTLVVGDYLTAKASAFGDHLPERGDIVLFEMPDDPSVTFVSRVVGLPGDRIKWSEGRFYLNGVQVDRRRIEDFVQASNPNSAPVPQYEETLPGGPTYRVIEVDGDLGPADNTEEFAVPDGHYFVAGDNRDGAVDSRNGRGFVPLVAILDKPLFLYWSADFSRIGKVIE